MTMAVFAKQGGLVNLPSLEIKVSFLAPSRAGKFVGKGRVLRGGKSIIFLEGELYDEHGTLTAHFHQRRKLSRSKNSHV